MTSQTNKLVEYAAPTRGRVKYASLTAGLLARKGEAMPATPYYAAEALDLYATAPVPLRHDHEHSSAPGPVVRPLSLHERAAPYLAMPSRSSQTWRPRHPIIARDESSPLIDHATVKPLSTETADQTRPAESPISSEVDHAQRLALTLDLDLEVLARLALHARHIVQSPSRVIEDALKAYFANGEICPACAQVFPPNS